MILSIMQVAFGVLLIVFSLVNNTNNFQSALVYKVLPFFGGALLVFSSLLGFGVIG